MRTVSGFGLIEPRGIDDPVRLSAPGLQVPITVWPSVTGAGIPLDHPALAAGNVINFCGVLPSIGGQLDSPTIPFSNMRPAPEGATASPFLVCVSGAVFKPLEQTPPEMSVNFWTVDLLYNSVQGDRKAGSWIRIRVEGTEGAENNHLLSPFMEVALEAGKSNPVALTIVGQLKTYTSKDKDRTYLELIEFERTQPLVRHTPTQSIASAFSPDEAFDPGAAVEGIPALTF